MALGASDILARLALATEPVELPGGGTVIVRELSVAQRGQFADLIRTGAAPVLPWLVVQAVVDENGERVFGPGDEEKVAAGSPKILEVIGQAVLRLSGMSREEGDTSGEG